MQHRVEAGGSWFSALCHAALSVEWAVRCALLHFFWFCRAVLVPATILFGTAELLSNSDDAVDIVLNSVAAGFIFELDEMLYLQFLTMRRRENYEARQEASSSWRTAYILGLKTPDGKFAAGSPRPRLACRLCTAFVFLLDFIVSFLIYLLSAGILSMPKATDWFHDGPIQFCFLLFVMLRTSCIAVFEMVVCSGAPDFNKDDGKGRWQRARRAARIVVYGCAIVGSTALFYTLFYALLQISVGYSLIFTHTVSIPVIQACLSLHNSFNAFGSSASSTADACTAASYSEFQGSVCNTAVLTDLEFQNMCRDIQTTPTFDTLLELWSECRQEVSLFWW